MILASLAMSLHHIGTVPPGLNPGASKPHDKNAHAVVPLHTVGHKGRQGGQQEGAAHASCRQRSAKPRDTKVAALGSSNRCMRILAFSSQVRSSMKILSLSL